MNTRNKPKKPHGGSGNSSKFKSKHEPRDRQMRAGETGPLTLYGFHAVTEALGNKARKIKSLHLTKNMADRLVDEGYALPERHEICEPRQLHKMVPPDAVHQGLIAVCAPLDQPTLEEVRHHELIIVLDQVTDPHNVGAIMRSASALGVGAVVTTIRNAPQETGLLAKTASGAFEHLPYIQVTNLARALEEIKALQFFVVGLDSEGPEELWTTLKEINPIKIALVLGAEGKGIRRLTSDMCDALARLDMPGPIKSLNVSVASALSLDTCRRALK